MKYKPIVAKSALHKLKRKYPYGWDLNIYRGCQHGCIYCYAIYSHDYLNDGNFFDTVYYKKELITALEKELSAKSWNHEVVNIGGVTDSYQPIESKLEIMRDVLKLMIKYQTPIIISTKSTLIYRDLDLIKELAKITSVNIAFTITTVNDDIQKIIEPGASNTMDRFRVLKQFKQHTNASIGVHIMPIIPYLTDNEQNLETIYLLSNKLQVDYVLPGTLYLLGKTKPYFLNKIKAYDYDTYQKINQLYPKGSASKQYKDELYTKINIYKKQYNISSNYMKKIIANKAML